MIYNEAGLALLAKDLSLGQLGLFAGAGVAIDVGCPTWDALIEELRVLAQGDGPADIAPTKEKLLAADWYRTKLIETRPLAFQEFLVKRFQETRLPARVGKSKLLRALMRTEFPFYVTTNYDVSLETAYAAMFGKALPSVDAGTVGDVGRFVQERPKACLHWHGHYTNSASVVLSESDYRRLYFRGNDYRLLCRTMFYQMRFLFVGASLDDDDLMYVLRELNATVEQLNFKTGRHYALLPYDPRDLEGGTGFAYKHPNERVEILRRKYSIEAIFFPVAAIGERFGELYRLLESLGPAPPNARVPSAGVKQVAGRARQKRVGVEAKTDPNDQQKGRWGGKSAVSGFKLSARVARIGQSDWYHIDLAVGGPKGAGGTVEFHLHQSFPQEKTTVPLRDGLAEEAINAWGAFTVGALVRTNEGRSIRLELDLAEMKGSPEPFRSR